MNPFHFPPENFHFLTDKHKFPLKTNQISNWKPSISLVRTFHFPTEKINVPTEKNHAFSNWNISFSRWKQFMFPLKPKFPCWNPNFPLYETLKPKISHWNHSLFVLKPKLSHYKPTFSHKTFHFPIKTCLFPLRHPFPHQNLHVHVPIKAYIFPLNPLKHTLSHWNHLFFSLKHFFPLITFIFRAKTINVSIETSIFPLKTENLHFPNERFHFP